MTEELKRNSKERETKTKIEGAGYKVKEYGDGKIIVINKHGDVVKGSTMTVFNLFVDGKAFSITDSRLRKIFGGNQDGEKSDSD